MIVPAKEISVKDGRKITLRSVAPAEAALMLEHLIISHSESYRNLNRDGEFWKTFPVTEEEKILTNMQSSLKKFMLGAFEGNKIVGGLGIFGNDDKVLNNTTATLGMSLQQKVQGLVLGKHMMDYALSQVRGMGIHRVELSVRTFNVAGIALYEKCGFRRVGTLTETALIDGKFESEYLYERIFS